MQTLDGTLQKTKAARPRPGGFIPARWRYVLLDREGVFEFFHPRLQILDFSLLLFQEQVFNPA